MNIENKKILVVGLGSSGAATASFLKKRGAFVTVTDMALERDLGPEVQKLLNTGIRLEIGEHHLESFGLADLIILSPGVPHTISPIRYAKEKGVPVLGEIELASRFIKEPIVAVTGTNGKTTTTTLIGEMLKKSGMKTFVGGNIGVPLISYPDNNKKVEIIVAEISSFQLDTIKHFRPKVAALLNIAEDHLDRYADLSAYVRSKVRIFENQKPDDTAIINGSDPITFSVTKDIQSRRLDFYNSKTKKSADDADDFEGAVIKGDGIHFNLYKKNIPGENRQSMILNREMISLHGEHNLENIAAAALAAMTAGGTFDSVKSAVKDFKGLSHRVEYVNVINNVKYYNDSKATNVDAVIRAIESFDSRIILILGGRNKGINFGLLEHSIKGRVKSIVAMGESKEEIYTSLSHAMTVKKAGSMEDAVFQASRLASPGDLVLLSPACASFDMFESYAHRGEIFCREVNKLKRSVA